MKERKSERKKDRKNDRNELLINGITNKWKYPQSPPSTVTSICETVSGSSKMLMFSYNQSLRGVFHSPVRMGLRTPGEAVVYAPGK